MAIQTIPGLTGFTYARVASMDKRAVGKLTDANHLESFHSLFTLLSLRTMIKRLSVCILNLHCTAMISLT